VNLNTVYACNLHILTVQWALSFYKQTLYLCKRAQHPWKVFTSRLRKKKIGIPSLCVPVLCVRIFLLMRLACVGALGGASGVCWCSWWCALTTAKTGTRHSCSYTCFCPMDTQPPASMCRHTHLPAACACTYVYMHMHVPTHLQLCTRLHTHTHACVCVFVHVCVRVRSCVYVYTCVCVYASLYIQSLSSRSLTRIYSCM